MTTSRKPSAVCRGDCLPTRAVLPRTRSARMLRGMLGLPPARPRRAGVGRPRRPRQPQQQLQQLPGWALSVRGSACAQSPPYSPTRAGSSQTVPQRGSGFCSSRKAMLHPGVALVCYHGAEQFRDMPLQGHATCNSCWSSRLPWTVGRAALPLMASGSTRARTTTSGKDGAATCCSSPSTGACFNVWAEKLLSSC